MKAKLTIDHDGVRFDREFDIEDESRAVSTLKETFSDANALFLKSPRRGDTTPRRKATVRSSNPGTTLGGGES